MGKKTQTVKQVNQPPAYISQAQQSAINQAQALMGNPLQQYAGQTVAGFTPAQLSAFNTINNAQGVQNPYLNLGAQYTQAATNSIADQTPLLSNDATGGLASSAYNTFTGGPSSVLGGAARANPWLQGAVSNANPLASATNTLMDPYTNQVVQATLAQMNNQDQIAQNNLVGNAVSAGAWGGDRAGVAQGVLGGQQALARDQTIAQLLSSGYGQAQQAALGQEGVNQGTLGLGLNAGVQQNQLGLQYGSAAQQAYAAQLAAAQQAASQQGLLNLYAGQQFSGLGGQALQDYLTGANAQLGIGNQQQQQAQNELNVPLQQFQAAQQYPYQQVSWLDQIINGTAGLAGGTSTSKQPAGSILGDITGLAMAGNSLGLFGSGLTDVASQGMGAAASAAGSAGIGSDLLAFLGLANRGGRMGMASGGGVEPDQNDFLKYRNMQELFGSPLFTKPTYDQPISLSGMASGGSARANTPTQGSVNSGNILRTPGSTVSVVNTPAPQLPIITPPSAPLSTSPVSNYSPPPPSAAQYYRWTPQSGTNLGDTSAQGSIASGIPASLSNYFSNLSNLYGGGFSLGNLGSFMGGGSGSGINFALKRGGVPGYDDGGDIDDEPDLTGGVSLGSLSTPAATFIPQSPYRDPFQSAPPVSINASAGHAPAARIPQAAAPTSDIPDVHPTPRPHLPTDEQGEISPEAAADHPPTDDGSFAGPFGNMTPAQQAEFAMAAGILGSRGRFAQAVGEGAQDALKQMQAARQTEMMRDYRQQDLALRSRQLDQELDYRTKSLGLEAERNASEDRYRTGELDVRKNTPHIVGFNGDGSPIIATPGGGVKVDTSITGANRSGSHPNTKSLTPNAAFTQANRDYDHYMRQDEANTGVAKGLGRVYNADGTPADRERWVQNRANEYLSGHQAMPNQPSGGAKPSGGGQTNQGARPTGVPPGAQYSPSQGKWWWKNDKGQWQSN